MTIRVTIEIVPYGREDQKYPIFRIEGHNQGVVKNLGFGHEICKYDVELFRHHNEIEQTLLGVSEWQREGSFKIHEHDRRDGAVELARRMLSGFCEEWG